MSKADKLLLLALKRGFIKVYPHQGTIEGTRYANKKARGCKNIAGYQVFTLHLQNERVQVKAHRAIWLAVNGPIPPGMVIDHINRNKNDNRIKNLRLADASLNAKNRRSYRGSNNPSAKLNAKSVAAIRRKYPMCQSYAKLAAQFDVSKSLVAQIIRKEIWQ